MAILAVNGGVPVKSRPGDYMKWPVGGNLEKEALIRVLHSGNWGTIGPESVAFASEYAAYCNAQFGVPVINGTVSLLLILRAPDAYRY